MFCLLIQPSLFSCCQIACFSLNPFPLVKFLPLFSFFKFGYSFLNVWAGFCFVSYFEWQRDTQKERHRKIFHARISFQILRSKELHPYLPHGCPKPTYLSHPYCLTSAHEQEAGLGSGAGTQTRHSDIRYTYPEQHCHHCFLYENKLYLCGCLV